MELEEILCTLHEVVQTHSLMSLLCGKQKSSGESFCQCSFRLGGHGADFSFRLDHIYSVLIVEIGGKNLRNQNSTSLQILELLGIVSAIVIAPEKSRWNTSKWDSAISLPSS
jgi:hypothetical protein